MRELFFEDPFWIYVMLGGVGIFIFILWWRSSDNSKAKWILVPILLGVVVFVVERLVETDREKILKATDAIAEDVRSGKLDVLESMMFRNFMGEFQGRELDKKEALELARHSMETHGVTDIEIRRADVDIVEEGRKASMILVTRMRISYLGPQGSLLLRWPIIWEKIDGEWMIVYGETPRIGM